MRSRFDSIGKRTTDVRIEKCGQTERERERKKEWSAEREMNDSIIVITFLMK
jgi:hypothetical protein